MSDPTVHASAVLVGNMAVLIRGPSGSGKSRLAFDLILAGRARHIPTALLIGDDRIDLRKDGGRLMAHSIPALAGLIEIRGLGIRRCEHVGSGPVGLVVDLAADDGTRLPPSAALEVKFGELTISRVPVAAGFEPLPLVLAALTTESDGPVHLQQTDCSQDIGNHIRPTIAPF